MPDNRITAITSLKPSVIRAGQIRALTNGETRNDYNVGVPLEHMQNLGWAAGNKVIISSDKTTDTLSITRAAIEIMEDRHV